MDLCNNRPGLIYVDSNTLFNSFASTKLMVKSTFLTLLVRPVAHSIFFGIDWCICS